MLSFLSQNVSLVQEKVNCDQIVKSTNSGLFYYAKMPKKLNQERVWYIYIY